MFLEKLDIRHDKVAWTEPDAETRRYVTIHVCQHMERYVFKRIVAAAACALAIAIGYMFALLGRMPASYMHVLALALFVPGTFLACQAMHAFALYQSLREGDLEVSTCRCVAVDRQVLKTEEVYREGRMREIEKCAYYVTINYCRQRTFNMKVDEQLFAEIGVDKDLLLVKTRLLGAPYFGLCPQRTR